MESTYRRSLVICRTEGAGSKTPSNQPIRKCELKPSLERNRPQFASCSLDRAILLLLIALAGTATSAAQTLKTGGTLEGTISERPHILSRGFRTGEQSRPDRRRHRSVDGRGPE